MTPTEGIPVTAHETTVAADPAHLMSLFAQRAAAGDVEGLVALYEPGAVFEPQIGTVLRGAEKIRVAMTELAGLRPAIHSGEPDVVIVDGVAIVSTPGTRAPSSPMAQPAASEA
jgi:hypothetical protein